MGDYILFLDDGISYRHIGKEKLFIAYNELVAEIMKIKELEGRRVDKGIIIGIRGSFPSTPAFQRLGLSSLSEGWFICMYNQGLFDELTDRLGRAPTHSEEAENAIDGSSMTATESRKNAPKNNKSPKRKKNDDTHSDDFDSENDSKWRFD